VGFAPRQIAIEVMTDAPFHVRPKAAAPCVVADTALKPFVVSRITLSAPGGMLLLSEGVCEGVMVRERVGVVVPLGVAPKEKVDVVLG
jgi:hypothetical protein